MIVSNLLEHGTVYQKIARKLPQMLSHLFILHFLLVYFNSYDVNGDEVITRDDLEKCLPPTVESQGLIQQLLRQWDMVTTDLFDGFLH